jgi:UDP-N-acetylmuramoyl-tripeptide--D-alanyl-D-alanine ligase
VNLAVAIASAVAFCVSAIRWLRVAQREHYIPGSVIRFSVRWWTSRAVNVAGAVVALVAAVVAMAWPTAGLVTAAAVAAGPIGLSLRGRTTPLRWTRRLGRLAVIAGVIYGAVALLGLVPGIGPRAAVAGALLAPAIVDLAALVATPLERRLSERFVRLARERLASVSPKVVAITGSYGKTSTKEYVRHVLAGRYSVAASPASFNNRMGLARAINKHLTPGTEVFVAEMGTYARGEIAELVSWIRPDLSVLTAVGPVHLERFRSLEAIAEAKSEIVVGASAVVLNADDPLVVGAIDAVAGAATLTRCSVSDRDADVCVRGGEVLVRGKVLGHVDEALFGMNVACAVGVALALDVPQDVIASRLESLPTPQHRRHVLETTRGVTVIDDTYNSNPIGAAAALELLARTGTDGARRVVVTPGMVELGREQPKENEEFAEHAVRTGTVLIVVGRTNRRSLVKGARSGEADVRVVDRREEAVAWVRENLASGDVVLYENDLPDHYP